MLRCKPGCWQARQLADISAICQVDATFVWLALVEGELVGFIGVRFHHEDWMGEIHVITVDPDFQRQGIGSRSISFALGWDATPALVIETTSVDLVRFCDVDEAFALAKGASGSLKAWREGHRDYFAQNGGFDLEMILVCQHFRVVENRLRR